METKQSDTLLDEFEKQAIINKVTGAKIINISLGVDFDTWSPTYYFFYRHRGAVFSLGMTHKNYINKRRPHFAELIRKVGELISQDIRNTDTIMDRKTKSKLDISTDLHTLIIHELSAYHNIHLRKEHPTFQGEAILNTIDEGIETGLEPIEIYRSTIERFFCTEEEFLGELDGKEGDSLSMALLELSID